MMERVQQTAWVLDHLDDLDADFLRFYRVDYMDLPGPRFFALAARVSVYDGMLTARIRQAEIDATDPLDAAPVPEGAKVVPLSEIADMIESG